MLLHKPLLFLCIAAMLWSLPLNSFAGEEDTDNLIKNPLELQENLSESLKLKGRTHLDTLQLQFDLGQSLLKQDKFVEADAISKKNWEDYIETGNGVYLHVFPTLLSGAALRQKEDSLGSFLAKIAGGHLLYAIHFFQKLDGHIINFEITHTLLIYALGKSPDFDTKDKIAQSFYLPNSEGTTPFNKGRAWMRGPEVMLYEQYGKVAEALQETGNSGTEEQKEAARRAFREWFGLVWFTQH